MVRAATQDYFTDTERILVHSVHATSIPQYLIKKINALGIILKTQYYFSTQKLASLIENLIQSFVHTFVHRVLSTHWNGNQRALIMQFLSAHS